MESLQARAATWTTTPRAASIMGENRLNAMVDQGERLGPGWRHMEEWGSWTDGSYVRLDLRIDPTAAALAIRVNGNTNIAGVTGNRLVRVTANGQGMGQFVLPIEEPRFQMAFVLPAPESGVRESLILEFMIDNPTPYRLDDGTVADARLLGLGVHTIDIEQL